jgi:hypothetical protein
MTLLKTNLLSLKAPIGMYLVSLIPLQNYHICALRNSGLNPNPSGSGSGGKSSSSKVKSSNSTEKDKSSVSGSKSSGSNSKK